MRTFAGTKTVFAITGMLFLNGPFFTLGLDPTDEPKPCHNFQENMDPFPIIYRYWGKVKVHSFD